MDVNRDNFYDVLPEILNDINNADYVAIDGEFTGILAFDKMNYFDTPAERYKRHYECDRHYLMVQVGLAMVRCLNPTENRYSLKAYNFYLFPENETDAFDFRSKSSSLQFLAANRFDFVQLFLKGIPFVCRTKHLEKLKNSQLTSLTRRNNNRQIPNGNNNNNEKKSETMTNSPKQSEINNLSDADLLKKSMTGFSEVIWKLQESGKPVIGHNVHMDMLHIINQFFTPIPPSYDEYKSIVKSLFPKLIDTKTIASTSIFQNIISNTALNAVYKTIREPSFPACRFETADDFRYASGEHEHTAGYDATCTAVCMTKMMAYIAEKTEFKENPIEHTLINTFIGKLFYMRSFDLKYSDMLNDDDLPDRSCVFYVIHPQTWSTANIREFFSQWNLLSYDRFDLTTHILAVSLKKDTIETMLTKMRANDKNLTIIPYAEYNRIDPSTIKIKEPNHLFDIDPNNRKSNKRTYIDKDAVTSTQEITITTTTVEISSDTTEKSIKPTRSYNDLLLDNKISPTIEQLIEQKEKTRGIKRQKLFEYDDEW
ncbi:unnamed protein product [Rotaria sp. Silwood1]|nr:unnamed protein product [Rotaria sp. Silwood1]CAF1602094.1 unnamed protein product [Rotaria sp. Silwood1]CAF3669021.1 unnamed protein product [Rotaria sp. Silwood1]CAF4966008.1 unnamed protein product [Rotaria sp. Silwood1]